MYSSSTTVQNRRVRGCRNVFSEYQIEVKQPKLYVITATPQRRSQQTLLKEH